MEQMQLGLLANMSGTPSHDGAVVALTLNLKGGTAHSAAMSAKQMGGAIGFMMALAQRAAELRPGHASEPPQRVTPFAVSQLAFAKGKSDSDVVLSLRVGPLELSFEVQRQTLLASLARLQAPTPPAPAPKPAAAKPPPKPVPPRTGISAPKASSSRPKVQLRPKK